LLKISNESYTPSIIDTLSGPNKVSHNIKKEMRGFVVIPVNLLKMDDFY